MLACYSASEPVRELFERERERLAVAVEAALGGLNAKACNAAQEFTALRRQRYAALPETSVTRHDGTAGNCEDAEARMELIEGIADWASWGFLHDAEIATTEQLMRRYRAQQAGAFYMTGSMQLHLAAQLDGAAAPSVSAVARADRIEDAFPGRLLHRALERSCAAP